MSLLLQITSPADSAAIAELNLGPLQEPEAVGFAFETIGWPILAAVIFVVLLIITFFAIRKHIKNRYRREALEELQQIITGKLPLNHSLVLVKRTAIHAFGREKVGKLVGVEWLQFLDGNAKNVNFLSVQTEVEALIYKDEIPENGAKEKLIVNTKNWIKTHAAR